MHQGADLEELQERRKVAEAACGPCITRLYQVLPPFSTLLSTLLDLTRVFSLLFPSTFFIAIPGVRSNDARHGWVEHGWPHLQRGRRGEEKEGEGEEALSLASKCFLSQFCRPFSNTLLLVSMICIMQGACFDSRTHLNLRFASFVRGGAEVEGRSSEIGFLRSLFVFQGPYLKLSRRMNANKTNCVCIYSTLYENFCFLTMILLPE